MHANASVIVTLGVVVSLVLLVSIITINGFAKCGSNRDIKPPPPTRQLYENLTSLLLGDIWPIDEYCNDRRLNKLQEDDLVVAYLIGKDQNESKDYYNGSNEDEVYLANVKSTILSMPTCSFQTWGYESKQDLRQSGLPYTDSIECSKQLQQLLDETLTSNNTLNKTISISQINGHVPDNILDGNIHWTGSYAMCVDDKSRRFFYGTSLPNMRYCLGALSNPDWPLTANSAARQQQEWTDMNYFIRMGLCLPRSCDTATLKDDQLQLKVEQLAKRNLMSPFASHGHYKLTDIYCLPDDESPLRKLDTSSKVFIVIFSLWLLAVIYSTITWRETSKTPTCTGSNKSFQWKKNWSLWHQFEMFTRPPSYLTKQEDRVGQIGFYVLDVIKVIAGVWLVSVHGLIYYRGMLDNNREHVQLGDNWAHYALRHGVNMVSVFFIMAGFLMAHKMFAQADKQPISFWRVIVNRYLRLIPLYLIVYVFVKKFGPLLGSGPFWDYGMSQNSERRQCSKESWLVPVLFLASFITPFSHCLLTGWHLANDFQITMTIPILITIMKKLKSKSRALWLSGSLVAVSWLLCCLSFYQNKSFKWGHIMLDGNAMSTRTYMVRTSHSYVNPVYRMGSFYMGVIMAYLIVDHQKRKRAELKLNDSGRQVSGYYDEAKKAIELTKEKNSGGRQTSMRPFLMSFALIALATNIEVAPQFSKSLLYNLLGEDLARAFLKPLWTFTNELGWCLLMYNLLILRGPNSLHKILRWSGWSYLVKLNLCLILIHNEINRWLLARQQRALHFSWSSTYIYVISLVVISYFIALLVHLTVERPSTAIIDHYITKKWIQPVQSSAVKKDGSG